MTGFPEPITIIALAALFLLTLAGVWLVLPTAWRFPRPARPAPDLQKPSPLPDREIEPAHIWTQNAAPLVAQLMELRPDLAYLWGPRLADFLGVEPRYRGTGKAIATDLRLRQTRVGLVLMEISTISPLGVLLIAGQNNELAISLFKHLKLPYAEVHPRDPNAVAKTLSLFGLEAPITPATPRPAQPSKPLSTQAMPASAGSHVPEPRKPARSKSTPKSNQGRSSQTEAASQKPASKPIAEKSDRPAPETIPLPLHTRGEEPEDMFAARSDEPVPPDPTSRRPSLPAAANRPDIV
ncbi:hypothetical protein GCM10007420_21560 [Glycocaulis albus]|uniref:DUF2726 domain-containing protein n=1 Tax=Glycocaulis albus TaxID=1382801 RepID=A0ABQ1XW39_9PROT|nr:hypothetical protein [Glycocaulis albus]GGH04762.1 hypothetical protein GCM10007420_21560 [Glycocaulis albus]